MTLVRYLCARFLRVFAVALLFFTMVLVLVDLFMNLWRFIAQNVPASQIFTIMGLYIPKAVSFGLPLAVLFSVSYTLSELYAKNELTVIFASGIPLINFTFPLLVLSIGLTLHPFILKTGLLFLPITKKKTCKKKFCMRLFPKILTMWLSLRIPEIPFIRLIIMMIHVRRFTGFMLYID